MNDVWMNGLQATAWFLWYHTFVSGDAAAAQASGECFDLLTGAHPTIPFLED